MAYRIPHLAALAFCALGLFLAGPALRNRLLPTIATAALIAIFHTLTIVSARFHVPIEPLLALWGSAGLSAAAHALSRRRLHARPKLHCIHMAAGREHVIEPA